MTTVLLIEDDADLCALMRDALTTAGAIVHTAGDGPTALAMLDGGFVPDVVLSDLVLPGVLGTSVIEYLHTHPALARTRVALVTGSPDLAPKGVTVFTKPVPLAKLIAFVA